VALVAKRSTNPRGEDVPKPSHFSGGRCCFIAAPWVHASERKCVALLCGVSASLASCAVEVLHGLSSPGSVREQSARTQRSNIRAKKNFQPANDRLEAFLVEEYEVQGGKRSNWSKIGAA